MGTFILTFIAHEGVGTDCNRLPLRFSAAVINGFQRVALSEHHISDACNTFRNDDARKTVAISKCLITYARYAVRDDDARKPLAIIERIIPDARNAFRDSNTLQRGAAIKCTLSDLILFNQCAIIRRERRGKRECRICTIISDKIALVAVVEEAIAV